MEGESLLRLMNEQVVGLSYGCVFYSMKQPLNIDRPYSSSLISYLLPPSDGKRAAYTPHG